MHAQSVFSEAWRNVLVGTTRAAALALIAGVLLGALAMTDVRAVVEIIRGAADFRAAGASVQIISAPGQINGQRCEGLSSISGVQASGAVRQGEDLRMLNLPSSAVKTFEATPGMGDVIGIGVNDGGLWLSDDLAQRLGAGPGDQVATDSGTAPIAGVYPYPADGRDRRLSYAALTPVPSNGAFDACWADIWPANPTTAGYLRTALDADSSGEDKPEASTLNSTLGLTYDAPALLASRTTRVAPWGALVIGLVLGGIGVRIRRVELASALQARVPRTAQAWQLLIETALWVTAMSVVLGVAVGVIALVGNPDPGWPIWLTGMRTVGVGSVAIFVGAFVGAAMTREKHLFRYFKDS